MRGRLIYRDQSFAATNGAASGSYVQVTSTRLSVTLLKCSKRVRGIPIHSYRQLELFGQVGFDTRSLNCVYQTSHYGNNF